MRVLRRSREGGLWLATDHGVVAYVNGGRARIITNNLPDMAAQTLTEDDDGSLWLTYNRGNLYQIKNGKVTFFTADSGLPEGASCSLAKDTKGRIWFAKSNQKDGQVGVYRDGHFQTLLHFGPLMLRLAAARAGGVWICAGSQLFKYSEGGKLQSLGKFMPELPEPRNPGWSLKTAAARSGLALPTAGCSVTTASILRMFQPHIPKYRI